MVSLSRLFAAAAVGACAGFSSSAFAAPPAGYTLAWSDEFHGGVGASADASNWNFEVGANNPNAELETYVNDLAHGHIVADPRATDGQAFQILSTNTHGFESIRMTTAHKKPFQYGFVEARIQLPTGQGIWPAFWMLGENIGQVGWPSCGEIDIMENIGRTPWENLNLSSLHSAAADPPHGDLTKNAPLMLPPGQRFIDSYHLFQMQWVKDSISFYVDGNLYETRTAAEYGKNPYPFNAPFFFLINTAVGGSWPGNPDATTVFPQKMLVDYVRVYKGEPVKPPAPRGLTAAPGDGRQIMLSWASDINATSYNVYRAKKRGEAGNLVATGVAALPFLDSGLTPGVKYFYRVAAVNGAGMSALSPETSFFGPRATEGPYGAAPQAIPGTVRLEDYDKGGEGVAYHDTDAVNNGHAYRLLQGVDVEASGNVGEGFDIGWTADGEWLKYTVQVAAAGKYAVAFRVSSGNGKGGTFHLEDAHGVDLTGPVTVTDTGGWQKWVSVTANVTLPAGRQTIKLVEDHAGYNLSSMTFTRL